MLIVFFIGLCWGFFCVFMVILFRFMGIIVFCFFVFGFFFIFEIGILEFVFFFGFVLFRGFLFEFFSNDNFFIIGLRVTEFSVFDVVEWVMRLVYWEEIRLLLSWLLLKKLFFKILFILFLVIYRLRKNISMKNLGSLFS